MLATSPDPDALVVGGGLFSGFLLLGAGLGLGLGPGFGLGFGSVLAFVFGLTSVMLSGSSGFRLMS
jgi:hypothetical protein